MPGFGYGPFGDEPFGDWEWARNVLFGLIPALYRDADSDQLLEKYSAGISGSYTDLLRAAAEFGDLRDPALVRSQYVQVPIELGHRILARGVVEQQGVNGIVTVGGVLETERGRFSFEDVGKEVILSQSGLAINNATYVVATVVSAREVVLDPPPLIDAGPLLWEIREKVANDPTQVRVEVLAGDLSQVRPGWIVSDGYGEFEVLSRTQFKRALSERKALVDREGADGTLNGLGNLVSPTAVFTQHDVGRVVYIGESPLQQSAVLTTITGVLSATEAELAPSDLVYPDSSALFWSVRRRGELVLQGPAVPSGLVEQYGEELEITAASLGSATLFAPGGKFSASDAGKLITILADASADAGTYEVQSVSSTTTLVVDTGVSTLTVGPTLYVWRLRAPSLVGDGTLVQARATSLLQLLAEDYGIAVDSREEEGRQRQWVSSVSKWIGLKGHENGYAYLGELTGFTVATSGLYRIDLASYIGLAMTGAVPLFVGDASPGKIGTAGQLFTVLGFVEFEDAAAIFAVSDIGRVVEVSGSGAGNDGLYEIREVLSTTRVRMRAEDVLAAAETLNGSLVWRVVRIYYEFGPSRPVYDEVNEDVVAAVHPGFTVDRYCWETGWSTTMSVNVTAVSPNTPSPTPIWYSVRGTGFWDAAAGMGEGAWLLQDSASIPHYLETPPVFLADSGVGRSGATASLLVGDILSDAAAAFVPGDVGYRVVLSGTANGNDQMWTIQSYISATQVVLDGPPAVPDANNGAISWEIGVLASTVLSTTPPALGAGTIEYICSEQSSCGYCRSNKVYVQATSSEAMEKPIERLVSRLNQARPDHVEFILSVGAISEANVSVTAVLETP